MFVEFTEQEKAEILAIEEKYEKAFKALEELMEKLNPTPNTEYLFEGINAKDNPEEWEAAIKKEKEILDAWEAKGSPEWKAAREKWHELSSSYNKERAELFKKAERRQFNELNGDLNNILEDAKNQTIRIIYELYQFFNNGTESKVLLDGEDVKKRIQGSLHLHIEALKGNAELYKEFKTFVDNTIKRSEYIAPKGTKQEDITKIPEAVVNTIYSEPLLRIYDILPNSPVTNLVKRFSMSAGKEIAASKNATIKTQETLNGKYLVSYKSSKGNEEYEEYEISIDNIQALKKKQSAKLRKVMNFILIKANEQHFPSKITFTLDEYMSKTGATSKDAAYRAAKKELDMLLGFQIAGTVKRGKKERRSMLAYVFTGRDVSYNQCEMRCNPDYVRLMCQYFSLLPQWAGELKTKAYDLLDYIYYMARQRQNTDNIRKRGHFNISLKAVNNYMGSHSPEDTQRHTEYIIDPILNAITEIEETQKNNELKITPVYDFDYKNAHDFLNGYLQIEMEPNALNYYIKNGKRRNK